MLQFALRRLRNGGNMLHLSEILDGKRGDQEEICREAWKTVNFIRVGLFSGAPRLWTNTQCIENNSAFFNLSLLFWYFQSQFLIKTPERFTIVWQNLSFITDCSGVAGMNSYHTFLVDFIICFINKLDLSAPAGPEWKRLTLYNLAGSVPALNHNWDGPYNHRLLPLEVSIRSLSIVYGIQPSFFSLLTP